MCVCVCPCVRTCSSQHVTFLSHVRHGIQGSVAAPQRAPNPYMELEFTLICSRSPRPHLRCRDEDAQDTGKGDVAAHLQLVSVSCEYLSLSSGNTNQGNSRAGTLRVRIHLMHSLAPFTTTTTQHARIAAAPPPVCCAPVPCSTDSTFCTQHRPSLARAWGRLWRGRHARRCSSWPRPRLTGAAQSDRRQRHWRRAAAAGLNGASRFLCLPPAACCVCQTLSGRCLPLLLGQMFLCGINRRGRDY